MSRPKVSRAGFTLAELLVAMVVLTIVMLAVVAAMQSVQNAWRGTHGKVREFQQGRIALQAVSRHLTRATLDTRWSADEEEDSSRVPSGWVPDSELHYVSGPATELLTGLRGATSHAVFFQGAFGYSGSQTPRQSGEIPDYGTLSHVLNGWGYYIEFGADHRNLPAFMTQTRQGRPAPPKKQRFRLLELRQPAHEMTLFQHQPKSDRSLLDEMRSQSELYDWFRNPIVASRGTPSKRRVVVVAENILAMIVAPYEPDLRTMENFVGGGAEAYEIAPNYLFDSRRFQWDANSTLAERTRHQLPPQIEITLVALDEGDWDNLSEAEAIRQGESLLRYVNGRFRQPASYPNDLKQLREELDRRGLSHQILTRVLTLHGTAGRLAPVERRSSTATAGS